MRARVRVRVRVRVRASGRVRVRVRVRVLRRGRDLPLLGIRHRAAQVLGIPAQVLLRHRQHLRG